MAAPQENEKLRRIEHRVSEISSWLAARHVAGEQRLERLHALLESVRRELRTETQHAAHAAHDALAGARATVDEMAREDQVPQFHSPLRREELHALGRHLQVTAAVLPHLSNLDDPGWRAAHEAYERSWDDLHRAFEAPASEPSAHEDR